MQPVATPPIVDAAANLRRSVVVCAVLGVAAIVGLSVAGHPLMGVFGFAGLGLGAYNRLLQRAVIRFASSPDMGRHQFRRGVMARLGLITLLAIGLGVLVRPDGLGVFGGLAVFQIVMLIGAAVPVFRSLRPSA